MDIDKIKNNIKGHKLNFVVVILMLCLVGLEMYQIYTVSKLKVAAKNDHQLLQETVEKLSSLSGRVDDNNSALGSKIDILDSAIKPDEKHRRLIREVRDAIQKNTSETLDIGTLNRIAYSVVTHSYTYNLSIAQVLAQIKAESNFNPKAESLAGAKGLMQIIDTTADAMALELGRKRYNIWNIDTNIEFGCRYMAKMLDNYEHDYIYALRAYNFGPHNVDEVRANEADYSIIKEVNEGGQTIQFLVNRKGSFIKNDDGQRIMVYDGNVPEEYRYPLETQNYIKIVTQHRNLFSVHGLDKVE